MQPQLALVNARVSGVFWEVLSQLHVVDLLGSTFLGGDESVAPVGYFYTRNAYATLVVV